MSGQGSSCYRLAEVAGNQLPRFPDWPAAQQQTAEYLSLYPNVLLGVQVDHVFAIILHPLSHDRTLESLQLFFVGDDAVTQAYAENRDNVLRAWREVFAEDVFAVEGMQQGRRSPGFGGGVFSTAMDGPTHHFHRWVAQFYASGLSAPGEGTVADRM
jgi:choline monooxygenase